MGRPNNTGNNTHRENKTDGYNRVIRDLERAERFYKAGLFEEGDDLLKEAKDWLLSQAEISEKMAINGRKGGVAKSNATSKKDDLLQAQLLAKTEFATSNKEINELIKKEINTPPLNPPPGDLPPVNRAIAEAWCEVAKEFGYNYGPTSQAVKTGVKRLIKDDHTDPEILKSWFRNFLGSGYPVPALDHFARNPVAYSKPQSKRMGFDVPEEKPTGRTLTEEDFYREPEPGEVYIA